MTAADRTSVTSVETYSGFYLDYLDPQPEHISVADIARGLAQTCRFAGQTTRYYSVAEHAVYVAELVASHQRTRDRGLALAALHHDSHEAYTCDWPTPLKNAIGREVFERINAGIDAAIAHVIRIHVELFESEAVKRADQYALRREAATLKYSHGVGPHWGFDEAWAPLAGIGWSPDEAERRFLDAHRRLSA